MNRRFSRWRSHPANAMWMSLLLAAVLPVAALAQFAPGEAPQAIGLPASAPQGSLLRGSAPPGSEVTYAGRMLRLTDAGDFVFGVARDASGSAVVEVTHADGRSTRHAVTIVPRDWPLQRVDGVPPKTVNPPPAIAARIAREQAAVNTARQRDDARSHFTQTFDWPVKGRISGRFGRARVYNGTPGGAHSGMDIAAGTGTPVKAPAAGVVTFADADMYLTGGTVVLDHGHGVSSNFLHLSRIDVQVGDTVAQGDVLGAVGATGRATGPHLHWGMNWFDVRVDPQLVLDQP